MEMKETAHPWAVSSISNCQMQIEGGIHWPPVDTSNTFQSNLQRVVRTPLKKKFTRISNDVPDSKFIRHSLSRVVEHEPR